MGWPPQPGEPLPRADACWQEPIKFEEWILAPQGHGREWQQVFGVGLGNRERVWRALTAAAQAAVIVEVRDRDRDGMLRGVRAKIRLIELAHRR